jgi:hypothetical protein
MRAVRSEELQAAAAVWIEQQLAGERRAAVQRLVWRTAAAGGVIVVWWLVVWLFVAFSADRFGVVAGWTTAALVTLLVAGAVAALRPGPVARAWDAWRRWQALQLVDVDGCAAVVALLCEQQAPVQLTEVEHRLPHLSMTQLRRDWLLFPGLRILPGPPPAAALSAEVRGAVSPVPPAVATARPEATPAATAQRRWRP